jgi:hypothetical protein
MLQPKYGLERTSSEPQPNHPTQPKYRDDSIVRKHWMASGSDPDDKSGTATFIIGALELSIPLSDSKYFFDLSDLLEAAIRESSRLSALDVEARIFKALNTR